MKAIIKRSVIALFGAMVCLGAAQAEDLKFSELEARLASIESQLAGQSGLQQASYCNGCGCESSCGCENSCCCESNCCDSCCSNGCGCCDSCCGGCGCCDCCNSCCGSGGYYAEFEALFLRTHTLEDAGPGGKTGEEYELATRWVVGYENCCGQGARLRYFHYGNDTRNLTGGPAAAYRVQMDIVDLDFTNRFQFCRTDVTLAGGVRLGNMEISQIDTADIDLIGITMAADVETLLCCRCNSYWSAIYGGRVSALFGDWEGRSNLFVATDRDDNIIATELYLGVEYGCCHCGRDIYTQLKFEVQNWHSDAILARGGDGANGTIGFVGPSWLVGIGF